MNVRAAGPADWRTWRELRLRALSDAPDAFGETLAFAQGRPEAEWPARMAKEPLRELFIAERDGMPVGMAVLKIGDEDPRKANVYAMWVAPEARGGGVGRALVDAALGFARSHAALDVSLRVTEGNEPATALYRAAGFADSGERATLREGSAVTVCEFRTRLPPLVMGVVNVTPDSFSDGGQFLDPDAAVRHGLSLWRDGADILDVGGEATNPRAAPISEDEERRRVLPVVERLAAAGATVSIDTTKASIARSAVAAGARIVNDVSGGLFDAEMAAAVYELGVTYIAGHLRGRTIGEVFAAERPASWSEVAGELGERIAALPETSRVLVWVDPGLGFGKGGDPETNLALIRHAGDLGGALRRPVVVGPSRKRFLRRLTGDDPARLDDASVTACLDAIRAGAHVVRIHDVARLRKELPAGALL